MKNQVYSPMKEEENIKFKKNVHKKSVGSIVTICHSHKNNNIKGVTRFFGKNLRIFF